MKNLIVTLIAFISFSAWSQQELITNGNFTSNSGGWTTTNNFTYNTTWSTYNFDVGYAYTSDGANDYGTLEQEFMIPSNTTSATLSFYTNIDTDEQPNSQIYDFCTVNLQIVGGGGSHEFVMLSNLDETNGYVNYSFSIPPSFYGEYVRLIFIFANDGATPTRFRFDNVSLIANTSSGGFPDYYITNAQSNTTSVQAGNTVDVSCDQGHQGYYSSAENVYLGYYLSNDITVSSNDHFFSNDIDYSYLTDGDIDPESATLTIPSSSQTGQYYLILVTDYPDQFSESNESNNTAILPLYVNGNSTPMPTVELISPNSFMCIPNNSTLTIQTSITGQITGKRAEFSLDNGVTWQTIEENLNTSNTTFNPNWYVPYSPEIENCILRITVFSQGGQVIDISDAPFVLIPPTQPIFFNPNGISHIYYPFESYNWNSSAWVSAQYPNYPGSYHGQGYHQCADYYAQDWAKLLANFYSIMFTCHKDFYSPINGQVISIEKNYDENCSNMIQSGNDNHVIIQSTNHPDFAFSILHLDEVNFEVELGDYVEIGDLLGKIGATGTYNAHAHCVLYKNINSNPPGYNSSFKDLYLVQGQTMTDTLNNYCTDYKEQFAAEFKFDAHLTGSGGSSNINELDSQDDILIYPNPTTDGTVKVMIQNEEIDILEVFVFNVTGQIVDFTRSDEKTIVFDNLDSGTYLFKYNIGISSFVRKFVVL